MGAGSFKGLLGVHTLSRVRTLSSLPGLGIPQVQKLVRPPGFEPGSTAWQAAVLVQARLRPPRKKGVRGLKKVGLTLGATLPVAARPGFGPDHPTHEKDQAGGPMEYEEEEGAVDHEVHSAR